MKWRSTGLPRSNPQLLLGGGPVQSPMSTEPAGAHEPTAPTPAPPSQDEPPDRPAYAMDPVSISLAAAPRPGGGQLSG
jgi:hypothetical protein